MRVTVEERFRTKNGERVSKGWFLVTREGRKERIKKAEDREAAEAMAAQLNADARAAEDWLVGGPLPCDEALRGWIAVHAAELSPSTEETHRNSIETHLVPFFGSRDLRYITRDDVRAFVVDRFEKKKSAATIKNALSALRRVYSLHIEAGLLEQNPAAGAGELVARIGRRYAGQGVREVDAWKREEVALLLEKARKHERFLYPVLFTALSTGMRRSELIALRWEHIQPDEIRVRDAFVKGKTKTPKSDLARSIPYGPDLKAVFDELRRTRKKREGAWSDPGLVFTNPQGVRWDPRNLTKAFKRLTKLCVDDDGKKLVRPLTLHCCRHTFASWAFEAGRSVVWVQTRLGHATPDTTLRTYSHFIPREREDMGFLALPRDPDHIPTNPDQNLRVVESGGGSS